MSLRAFRPCVIVLLMAAPALANNNLFLPGDAYFPTELTAERLRKLADQADEGRIFEYSSFGGYEGMFCGYAGYQRAKIPGVDAAFVANLTRAYQRIRDYEPKLLVETTEDGVTKLTETNGMRVLFYPQAFEFPRFHVGLRYNENWVKETENFGHKADYIRVCEIVDHKDAVVKSWRDSARVGSFEILLPKVKIAAGESVDEPFTIKGKVKAFVFPARPLQQYFSPEQSYTSILVVDSGGVVEYVYVDEKWSQRADSK